MEEQQNIVLVQEPVIRHRLIEIGRNVTSRLNELNVDKLVATNETIKSLKQLRAELNNEFKEFESQRKSLKEAVAAPYLEFETTYKEEITEKFKSAVDVLKNKISDFENKVKTEKKEVIENYFKELCLDTKIDFLKFSDTGIDINLSTSEKKYKEACSDFVSRVADDVMLIEGTEYPAEIMVQYKTNGYNASKAITEVNNRKEEERLANERLKQAETMRRQSMLRGITMVHHDMTRTFTFVQDDSIIISDSEIENLPKNEFEKKFVELESKIKEYQNQSERNAEPEHTEEKPTPKQVKTPEPIQAPVEETPVVKEKEYKAVFECTGTMKQLKALGEYMKENNIIYKNL